MPTFELVEFKFEKAKRRLDEMGKALVPPMLDRRHVAVMSSGAVLHHEWREPFDAELNGFLSTTRSVPELIQYRFGYDRPNKKRNAWLLPLDQKEQARRIQFHQQFEAKFEQFRQLPLTEERHITEHRNGIAHWEVRVRDLWGREYVGGPKQRIPDIVSAPTYPGDDPALACVAANSILPLIPKHTDFWWAIPQPGGGLLRVPLFPECRKFLAEAEALVTHARALFQQIHGGYQLTLPPP
jgi:hypothetical protein